MSVVNQRSQHKSITNSQVFFVTTCVCYFLLVTWPLCLLGTNSLFSQDDGSFQLQGRCVRRCTTPPALPNSIAVYNNSLAQTGATSAGCSVSGFFGGLKPWDMGKTPIVFEKHFKPCWYILFPWKCWGMLGLKGSYISWESKIKRLICGTP